MILLWMGTNLISFVLSVVGAQYFMHELIGSWSGMSHSEIFLTLFSSIEVPQEFASLSPMRAFICWRTTHVRVLVFLPLDPAEAALILLNLTREEELRREIQRRC
jgi:hypothetical protein